MRRNIRTNVLNRVAVNRQRVQVGRDRQDREAAAIRALAAPIPARVSDKVQSLDVAYSARRCSDKQEQKE